MRDPEVHSIRVYLIDDHPVLREGFAKALDSAPGMTLVGQAGTAAANFARS